jgi:type I restriction enzyme S subunit
MKEGWTYKKLGEVCEIFGRIGFRGYTKADLVDSPNDGAITLSPSNIVNGEMDYSKCSYITWAKYEESPEIMIYPGDILLVKTASVGKTALVRDLPHKATINPQFVVFKNIETNHDYLSYYMKSEKAQKYIWSIAKGAAAQTVSQKNLAEMQVPVPTKAEQQRIVSRLDSAFAHIDELKANAEKQLSEARALFQKALSKAMEPKEGWTNMKLGEFAYMKAGDFVKASEIFSEYKDGLFPCYGGNGFRGYVRESNQDGDYCMIGRQGALCGCINRAKGIFRTTEHAVIVKPYDNIPTSLVYYMLISLNLNKYSTGAAQTGLSVKNIAEQVIISVPPNNT